MINIKVIELSQGRKAIIDDEDYVIVSKYNWYAHVMKNGSYAIATIPGTGGSKKIYLHRLLTDAPKGMQVDHINGITLDNRRSNLRVCTIQENLRNKKKRKKYKGTTYAGKGRDLKKPWTARIKINDKPIHLGYFETEVEAAKAYDEAAKEIYGEFANLNFKEGVYNAR